ncbi:MULTISPECIES: hypothetical protein [Caloramator]|uniref:Uncharacterized protein n=1 Tax=Caloramator proteoclasticus DSM 10124 TaxID=1121262 RepID=A0A1M4W472_9CLOT|nr:MULTISPECIES: hypothetical protein [Caloramator]SHE75997.1 hypothetical protein SAMN02746091_01055 [Caloramator proteoclasticus DSM 10124]
METKYKERSLVGPIFKMNSLEKTLINLSYHLKGIKVSKESMPIYREIYNDYLTSLSYFSQSLGFIKCLYLCNSNPSMKSYLLNNLFTQAYRKLNNIDSKLKLVEVDDIYLESKKILEDKISYITSSMKDLLDDLIHY